MVCPCINTYNTYNSNILNTVNTYVDIVYAVCGDKPSIKSLLRKIAFPVRNVTVYTKCKSHKGYTLLQNKGRIDETYLRHIVNNYERMSGLVLFAKHTLYRHTKDLFWGYLTKTVNDIIRPETSFGCLMSYPIWHSCQKLLDFELLFYDKDYDINKRNKRNTRFRSNYNSLGNWALNTSYGNFRIWETKLNCPVCYGGTFVTHSDNIKRIPKYVWKKIHNSLLRGDNIEESHFMERYWAMLLTKPLDYQTDIELEYATIKGIIPPEWLYGIKSNCTCV